MMSVIKKSRLQFKLVDIKAQEVSLHEVYKSVFASRAIILHLLDP